MPDDKKNVPESPPAAGGDDVACIVAILDKEAFQSIQAI
jgi:hypothetical protein